MPFQTELAIVGGNLDDEIRQKVNKFLTLFDCEIREQVKEKGINPLFVKLLHPLNYAVVATTNEVHIVATNQNVSGILHIQFIDLNHKALNLQTTIYIIERDLMYSSPFGISFPNFYLELSESNKEKKAKKIIEKYLKDEILTVKKMFGFYLLNCLANRGENPSEHLKFFKI
jgi:hypothetical protein